MKAGELGWNAWNNLSKSGQCENEAGGKTVAVRCNMWDEQGRGEEEGQLWSREIVKLERSNGERGVGGWEQRGGRLVVFSTPTMWGRGLAIVSDTTDNRSISPYHYLFVLLGCLFPAETPLISPSDYLNSSFSLNSHLSLSTFKTPPSFLVSALLYHLLLFILTFSYSDLLYFLLSCASLFPTCFTCSLLSGSVSPFSSLSLSFFPSFPLFLPVCMSQLAGGVGLRGPGAAEHG